MLFSGTVGSLVGSSRRLPFIRYNILLQKATGSAVYAIFLILFVSSQLPIAADARFWGAFSVITLLSSVLKLSTIGMSVAIERDWVTTVSEGHDERLTYLNT